MRFGERAQPFARLLRIGLPSGEVAEGNDADEPVAFVENRQAAHLAIAHLGECLLGRVVLAAGAAFRLERLRLQHEQLDRLADRLPLPQLHLPLQLAAGVGPGEVRALAADFVEQIERVPG